MAKSFGRLVGRACLTPLKGAAAVVLAPALAACGLGDPAAADDSPRENAEDLYEYNGAKLWNNNSLGAAAAIPVCFIVRPRLDLAGTTQCPLQGATTDCFGNTITPSTGWLRLVIAMAIQDNWMRGANIELYGWGDCPIDAATNKHKDSALKQNIVIQFGNAPIPPLAGISWEGACQGNNNGCVTGMSTTTASVINYNWPAILNGTDNFNLLHEFGHALGFGHEWRRPDYGLNISGCTGETTSLAGTYMTSFPDPSSKMQYCNPGGANTLVLSAGDIMGMWKAYGRKYKRALVGYGGQCAATDGGNSADGTPIIAWPCRNQPNDSWRRANEANSTERLQSYVALSSCLNVSGGTAPNPVNLWTCGTQTSQRFTWGDSSLQGAELRAMGNMCVELVNGFLEIRACNGAATQRWDYQRTVGNAGYLNIQYLGSAGQCVTRQTSTGQLGEQLTLANCVSNDVKQQFASGGGPGVITLGNNAGLCLNVSGGLPNAGARIILWDGCGSSPNPHARFHLHGKLKALGNCLQIMGAGFPGDPINVQACDAANTTTQLWDYYF